MKDIRFLLKPKYTESRALIIGINKYITANPLTYAVNDATKIGELLISNFNFQKENVQYLLDERATKQNIIKSFLRFTDDDIGLDERIFVFYAGHGHTRSGFRGEVGYLVPHDADMTDFSTFIRWDDLTRNSELIKAKHVLFIMDACYGGLAINRNLQPGSVRFLKDMMLRYSRQVLTAGKADEVVADAGGPIPEHSVFTGHLINALKGNASNDQGVLTANSVMSYVYSNVATDKNSNQTPHYGYFDGDGDFIFSAPILEKLAEDEQKDIDSYIIIPETEELSLQESLNNKISKIKDLLSDSTSAIKLHDYIIYEIRQFLSESNVDSFAVQGVGFSPEEFLSRIERYEGFSINLAALTACIAYWALPEHKQLLQKMLARSTDQLDSQSGLIIWIHLRWYPIILQMYCSGIAAVEGHRYDSLANIFYTTIPSSDYQDKNNYLVEAIAKAISGLKRDKIFKIIPGHENHHTPMSEYIYKLLQPTLDDILFVGKSYEKSFDEFEVLLALVIADFRKQSGNHFWGPIGRFGWKHQNYDRDPLSRIIEIANAEKENWKPLKAGLFGGDYERFSNVAQEFKNIISKLDWW